MIALGEVLEARKEKIGPDQAWVMLGRARRILVGQGVKFQEFSGEEGQKAAILEAALGRSNTLRAPALKVGGDFIVGFSLPMYEKFFGK